MEKVISVRNLTKQYKSLQALKGISFEVRKGEIFGILGPNGAGKTTTLEIIEGIKAQTSGQCAVLGYDNLSEPAEIKRKIGVQLQNSEYFNYLTLTELLELFASLYGKKTNAPDLLKKFGLEDKAGSTVKELSGGQKQRFTIATALAHDPEMLFLDEPTTGLDPKARHDMWRLIKELNRGGMTIIMTTHYMEEAEFLCHRLAILDHGKILKLDSPENLISEVSKIYKISFFVQEKIPADLFAGFGLKHISSEYPKVSIEAESLDVLPKILEKLKSEKITCSFLNIKSATLEEVYLLLTGREYEE